MWLKPWPKEGRFGGLLVHGDLWVNFKPRQLSWFPFSSMWFDPALEWMLMVKGMFIDEAME